MKQIPVVVEFTEAEARQLLNLLDSIRYSVTMSEAPFVNDMSHKVCDAINLAQHYEDELQGVDNKAYEDDLPF